MIKGIGVKKDNQIHGVRIIDLVPTILYLHGIPVPYDMDGSVINDIFDTNSLSQPLTYKEKMSKNKTIGAYPQKNGTYTEEEARNIEERLRSLGYVD